MDQLDGKTAVITGAASGMGRAFAERFAQAGMNVVLADVEGPALDTAVTEITATGVDALGVVTDVSDEAAVDTLAARAIDRFGQVHILCNNAGVSGTMGFGPGAIAINDWKWVLDVNFWGVVNGHKAFLPHILDHGDGHIINTASMAGHFPGHGPYSASKWAVVAITEGLYQQLKSTGSTVGVSCLCPGWVDTRIGESSRNRPEWAAPDALAEPSPTTEMAMAFIRDQIASGRQPAEVAELVHQAVLADQFWIFTDTEMVKSLADRFESVLGNRNPAVTAYLGDD